MNAEPLKISFDVGFISIKAVILCFMSPIVKNYSDSYIYALLK